MTQRALINRTIQRIESAFEHMAFDFFSGVQNFGNGDVWGGYGDITTNLHQTFAFKARHPDARVRLIVVDYARDRMQELRKAHGQVSNTADIVSALVPGLDPDKKDIDQMVHGVAFQFPSQSLLPAPKSVGRKLADLRARNFGLVFSDNQGRLAKTVALGGGLSFVIDEPGRDRELTRRHKTDTVSGQHCLNAGAFNLGLYVRPDVCTRPSGIDDALARDVRGQSGGRSICFVYPGRESQLDVYFDVAQQVAKRMGRDVAILTIGRGAVERAERWPQAVHVALPKVPLRSIQTLVWLSDLPPIVTGCMTLCNALDTAQRGRGYVYSRPSWKQYAARDMCDYFAGFWPDVTNPSEHRQDMKRLRLCNFAAQSDLREQDAIPELADAMCDSAYQQRFAQAVTRSACDLSLIKNVEVLMKWLELAPLLELGDRWTGAREEELFAMVRQAADFPEFADNVLSHVGISAPSATEPSL